MSLLLEVSVADIEALATGMNLMWALTVTFLIFFMHAGFAMLEAGQVRSKNVANQLTKNMLTWAVGIGVFFVVGMGISNNVGAALGGGEASPLTMFGGESFDWTMWLFSAVFAMTAATIVSGAVAGRAKLRAYVGYTFLLAAVIYPVVAAMVWYAPGGTPILASLGFADFAGGMVVHGVGGIAGLTAAYILGARIDKYNSDGSANVIPGHSMTFAVLGTLILCFGWFGFNVGTAATVVSFDGAAEAGSVVALGDFAYVGSVAIVTALGMGLARSVRPRRRSTSTAKSTPCTSQTACWPASSVSLVRQTSSPRWVQSPSASLLARSCHSSSALSRNDSKSTTSVRCSRSTDRRGCSV